MTRPSPTPGTTGHEGWKDPARARSLSALFVYGTLRRAARQPAHRYLAGSAEPVGEGVVAGTLHHLGRYPGAVEGPRGGSTVRGEVYRLVDPARTLALLDAHEGCGPDDEPPYEFERAVTEVSLSIGEHVRAWIYWYRRAVEATPVIASGDWLRR